MPTFARFTSAVAGFAIPLAVQFRASTLFSCPRTERKLFTQTTVSFIPNTTASSIALIAIPG
jgi:hypothetical protein